MRTDAKNEPRQRQIGGSGYRPWFSRDGKWIYFFKIVKDRRQICKLNLNSGEIFPLPNDDKGSSRGPFEDLNDDILLIHSTRGGKCGIWELPLDGSPPRQINIPYFEEVFHGTRSTNNILAFDVPRIKNIRKKASWLKLKLHQLF